MNLETNSSKKAPVIIANEDIEFDFKPITSGLGFHNNNTKTEIKPAFSENMSMTSQTMSMPMPAPMARKENQIYQNELSVFYGREEVVAPVETRKVEKVFRQATKSQRVLAYVLDLGLVLSAVAMVLTIMSRLIEKDLMDVWATYPNEITPLVVTLFSGFYLMYFSIFEKTSASTFGKNLLGITVVDLDNKSQNFTMLVFRSFISLMNFVSLGLFAYFNLQNKVSNTKVIKVD
ncbi:MAG: RDD family protein [Bdellovibrionales bacterium]|nr:RDD family protein [Bdellovibrionales bacterium]